MSKKIYDIKPPKVIKTVNKAVKKTVKVVKRAEHHAIEAVQEAYQAIAPKKRKKPSILWVAGGALLITVIICGYFYYSLQSATITIWPSLSDLSVRGTVTASSVQKAVDLSNNIIPARYIESVQSGQQDFPATGTSANNAKASGRITIYNNISPAAPLTLKAGTHFLSDSGKYFVTLDKIVVPAAKGKTAGSITVKVQAQDSGSDYNIGPSKFSVPKLSGTSYFYSIWGASSADMVGGTTGTVKLVSASDITLAQDVLSKHLYEQAQTALKSKLASGDVLLENSLVKTIVSSSSDAKAQTAADHFRESVQVKVSALVFSKADMQQIVEALVQKQLTEGSQYKDDTLQVNYTLPAIDVKKGVETISMDISAKAYKPVDVGLVTQLAEGKSADQIRQAITQQYGSVVAKTQVRLWPFWTTSAPFDAQKISVEVTFK